MKFILPPVLLEMSPNSFGASRFLFSNKIDKLPTFSLPTAIFDQKHNLLGCDRDENCTPVGDRCTRQA